MRGYMFRNRWAALLFVALTLAGVTKLVGTEREKGTLQEATEEVADQRQFAEQMTTATVPSQEATIEVLPSDEELIDPATGYDPTPVDEFASGEAVAPADQVVIVSRDAPAEGQQQLAEQ